MPSPELAQLKLLAEVDELVGNLTKWAEGETHWEPLRRSRALVRRLLSRVERLRVRLESPLVVATFGGTGTGKSSLVNALVGQDCTDTGRQRPTTTQPILLVHPQLEPEALGLPLDEMKVVRVDAPILRDIVIVDCPDPDTSETETRESNLHRLHQLLPHCDVLLYTSTQQKYRSARVGEELGQAATGCRILFVQTHADIDSDIRDDWRGQLSGQYEVPDMFFVDSVRALQEQQAAQRPSGDFGRLLDVLQTQLAASQRIQIRRANLLDLIQAVLEECRQDLSGHAGEVARVEQALDEERRNLTQRMTERLQKELMVSRSLWERRLLASVTELWGFSPFSSILRLYGGLGNLVASWSLFRARNSAQVALIGAMQGARWLKSRHGERDAEAQLQRIGALGLDDDLLRESRFVMAGYVQAAHLDSALIDSDSLDEIRGEAARLEERFLSDARDSIDRIIDELAAANSGFFTRVWYEVMFLLYVGFVLYRVGRNFFYDSFWNGAAMLSVDFYVAAGIFFLLWSGVLVMAFTQRLRRGLKQRIRGWAEERTQKRVAEGLFPRLEHACREIEYQRKRLEDMAGVTAELRERMASSSALGAQLNPAGEVILVPQGKAE